MPAPLLHPPVLPIPGLDTPGTFQSSWQMLAGYSLLESLSLEMGRCRSEGDPVPALVGIPIQEK
jgi:hypothetical protein